MYPNNSKFKRNKINIEKKWERERTALHRITTNVDFVDSLGNRRCFLLVQINFRISWLLSLHSSGKKCKQNTSSSLMLRQTYRTQLQIKQLKCTQENILSILSFFYTFCWHGLTVRKLYTCKHSNFLTVDSKESYA